MSSLVDDLFTSDRPSVMSSSAGMLNSQLGSEPQMPPSSSLRQGMMSDDPLEPRDQDKHNEDEIREQMRLRSGGQGSIPKVTDAAGELVMNIFERFLEEFEDDNAVVDDESEESLESQDTSRRGRNSDRKLYLSLLGAMKKANLTTLFVDFQHLIKFGRGGGGGREDELDQERDGREKFAEAITQQYYRFMPFLERGLRKVIKRYQPDFLYGPSMKEFMDGDDSQQAVGATQTTNSGASTTASSAASEASERIFQIAFYNLAKVDRIRELKTAKIGQLNSISGTVTRTSEVRPELYRATFQCDACRAVVEGVEQVFKYTEPYMCPNPPCGNRTSWTLMVTKSQFVDWQKVRIQENSSEIPTGSMPRTLDVVLRGQVVERAKAGDKCIFTGTSIVIPDVAQLGLPGVNPTALRDSRNGRGGEGMDGGIQGLKALGARDLTYKMAFLACYVKEATTTDKNTNDVRGDGNQGENEQNELLDSLDDAEVAVLKEMINNDNIYSLLVDSIAPTVYGHELIKKGILLQLMGGVHKTTIEGINLRGDINVCIVGDPSTSKSQFLKYVCGFLPRAVYTSGKASSAAGLTAAVVKDEETGEHTIEAGALMLADNGICAIDEFDKMDLADQVAIHEAMEQQTISIAKAGIQATLNARTSILAAANPIAGRYNRKQSLRANINMSAPIMSRFDLFFVVLDDCNEPVDRKLADHIVSLHMMQDEAITPPYSTEELQRYIRYARTFAPKMTKPARDLMVELYKELRADDAQGLGRNSYRITVRQLESMIRLCEAIARANCSWFIGEKIVREAYNLLRQSIIHVDQGDVDIDDEEYEDNQGVALANEETQVDGEETMRDDPSSQQQPPAKSQRIKLKQEEYTSIMNILTQCIVLNENEGGDGATENDLVMFYLQSQEDNIPDEATYNEKADLCRKVIKRLVKDNIFMKFYGEGFADEAGEMPSEGDSRVLYVLHPNFADPNAGLAAGANDIRGDNVDEGEEMEEGPGGPRTPVPRTPRDEFDDDETPGPRAPQRNGFDNDGDTEMGQ